MEALICCYGLPLRYYVDFLRVFRFVQYRDSFWKKLNLRTNEADPQWKHLLQSLGVEITYALSPQAKGKIERSYRWPQVRIVRTSALEKLSSIEEVRQQIGGPGVSDDDLLLRYIIQEEKEMKALREAAPIKAYPKAQNLMMALIQDLLKVRDADYISVRKRDLSITLQKEAKTE